ncbi:MULTISPECIES: metallophosphoesterase [unclassified Paenibacillus]|uniref:metallophosphoesterase n=1 Tax=unclassified Paenibacillus TaxID=185978 RepID=UPI00362B138C
MNSRSSMSRKQKTVIIIAVLIALAGLVSMILWSLMVQTKWHQAASTEDSFVLSLDNGDFVRGIKVIGVTSATMDKNLKLLIDGTKMPTKPVMEQNALLTLEINDMEAGNGYLNSVWVNDKLVHTFENNATTFTKVTIPVPAHLLKSGNNKVTFRSGSLTSRQDEAGEHDDWRFRALKFELGDGTVLDDPNYKTATTYTVGDAQAGEPTNLSLYKDFNYTIKDEKFRTFFYLWDTQEISDGSHQIQLLADGPSGKKAKAVTVQVDNTSPTLEIITPIEGRTYKNKVNVNVKSTDEGSGSGPLVIKLDGKLIELPAEIDTTKLAVGEHKLDVAASDKAGNERDKTVTFRVLDEKPNPPVLAAPADLSTIPSKQTALSVRVSDATDDPMKVSFYKAKRYDLAQSGGIHESYAHAVDREPPLTLIPSGETVLTPQDRELVATRDGKYLLNNDKENFPYHRFSFNVGSSLPKDAEAVWTGHSLPDRLVTMYLWNYEKAAWDDLDSNIGTEDFTLHGKIIPAHVRNERVEVLVQDRIPSTGDYDFAFVWMTDTQYYSESYPKIYDLMTQWVVDNWKEKKFKYLLHTGDIVNNWNSKAEWERASASMKTLDDAHIPYGVVAGNHDVYYDVGNYDEFWKYFGRERFVNQPTFGGDLNNNRDHYDLVSVNGHDFVIVYLGWLIDQKTFDWANGVLHKYSDRNAIIATHEYLKPSKAYYGQGKGVWEKLVVPNSNVFMVLGGHNPGAAYNIKKLGDRTVLEMLSDYQNGPEGGQGFMRFLQFDLTNNKLLVNTYSPYIKKWNFFKPDEDDFVLPLNLKPIEKQVATDYIGIYACTNDLIGQVENVPSGSSATVTYNGLQPDQQYDWYAVSQDEFGGQSKSEVWSFHTK